MANPVPSGSAIPLGSVYDPLTGSYIAPDGTHYYPNVPAGSVMNPITGGFVAPTGQTVGASGTPVPIGAHVDPSGNVVLPNGNLVPNTGASGGGSTGTANGPAGTTTIGYNGNQGLSGTQQPGIFGTGTYIANPYAINDPAITGNPIEPASSNYGLNQTWLQLQGAINQLAPQNYATGSAQLGTAPQTVAAQGVGAQGTAAQGSAAQSFATTGGPASYNAATGNASIGGPSNALAAQGYGNAFGQAAQGGPSFMGAAQGAGALGQATQGQAAQMLAAQGGYALGGPQNISTAGDQAWQAGQGALANTLATTANGGGVSPADLQLKRDQDAQIAAQLAVLGSQRGNMGNAALATRAAADQAAQTMQATNAQYGVQRAQETLAAQQALGNVLGTARGQAQGYNLNQAQLAQQMGLANLGNAQAATMQNAGFQQQGAMTNQAALQQAMLANLAAQNSQTQQNVGNLQQAGLANLGYQQGANEFNAQQAQQAMLANLGAQNQMAGLNLGNLQGLNLANLSNAQQTALFNAGQNQAMTLANMGAANQMTGLNLGALNAANAGNAGMSQASNLANLAAVNQMTGQNSAQAQQMAMANLAAQNQFALSNLGNAQAMGLANLGTAQQSNIANQAMLGQYGLQQGQFNQQAALANQQAAINAQQQYYNMLLGLTGATTGIAQSNRAAQLANQQLQVQQQIANNQVNAQAFASSAGANANLAGAVIGGVGALGAAGINALANSGGSSGGGTANNLPQPTSGGGGNVPGTNTPLPVGGSTPGGPSTSTIADISQNPAGLAGVNPSAQTNPLTTATAARPVRNVLAASDSRLKTNIRPGRRALEAIFAISDENLKTGIEGGNPMMRSFLDQYEEFHNKQANVDPTLGENFRLTRGMGTAGGVTGGSNLGSQIGAGVGGAAGGAALGAALGSVVPGIGTAIGGVLGGLVGSQAGGAIGSNFDSSGHYVGGSSGGVTATGEIGNENISDEPDWAKLGGEYEGNAVATSDEYAKDLTTPFDAVTGRHDTQSGTYEERHTEPLHDAAWMAARKRERNSGLPSYAGSHKYAISPDAPGLVSSDDQAKENVISGNRGMQSFLNQANAQQQAQANQGQQNNAFMQTGQAPSTQVDRQLPPMQDPNAGYGQPQNFYGPGFGGYSNAGFQSAFGNTYGGGITQGGGVTNPGYFTPGGITQNAGYGGNFGVNGGGWTQGPIQWGGVANQGGYNLAGIDAGTGGMTDFGNVNQGATLTQPWIDFGGVTGGGGGSMANAPNTAGAFTPVNANPTPPAPTAPLYPPMPTAAGNGTNNLGAVSTGNILGTVQPNYTPLPTAAGNGTNTTGAASTGSILGTVSPNNIYSGPPAAAPATPAAAAIPAATGAVLNTVTPLGAAPSYSGGPPTDASNSTAGTAYDTSGLSNVLNSWTPIPATSNRIVSPSPVGLSDEEAKKNVRDQTQLQVMQHLGLLPRTQRMNVEQQGDVEDAMDNADPNNSPSMGYVPMYPGQGFDRLPGPSDYNYFHTPTPVNFQAAREGAQNAGQMLSTASQAVMGPAPVPAALPMLPAGQPMVARKPTMRPAQTLSPDQLAALQAMLVAPTPAATSDEEEKTSIQNDPASIHAMLDQLQAHQYRYKDPTAPGAGPGTYVSPMAQELEKTDLGKNFVRTGPDGYKQVDYGHALGTMLAGQAMLHHTQTDHDQRLSEVERMLSQLRGGG